MRFLAVLALDFAAHEQIEFLFRGAKLDVGFKHDGIVGDEKRIEQFMDGDGLAIFEARTKVFVLEHAGHAIFRAEPHDVVA